MTLSQCDWAVFVNPGHWSRYSLQLVDMVAHMARGRADLANTALRIFLQEMGEAYDEQRGRTPYRGDKDFQEVKTFFEDKCCYCGVEFSATVPAVQDHLIPMNKTKLGLHAWGNVVPACHECNAKKQGKDWREFIIQRAGADADRRHSRIKAFVETYAYSPTLDLRGVAAELYDEVGAIAMSLITAKVKRIKVQL